MRPLFAFLSLALLLPFATPAGAETLCDAPEAALSSGAPCVVDGPPIPLENVACVQDALASMTRSPVGCVFEPVDPSGRLASGVDIGAPPLNPDDGGSPGCTPYVTAHGVWSYDPVHGNYLDGYTAYFQLHTCAGKTWSQSLRDVTVTPGAVYALRGYNQVSVGWGDYQFHNTCITFGLSDLSTASTCVTIYN